MLHEELVSGFEIRNWNLKTFTSEIYENIGQILSLARLQIASLDPAKKDEVKKVVMSSGQLLGKAIRDLRKLAKLLTPDEIIQKGFTASLKSELDKLNELGLCVARLSVKGNTFRQEEIKELILFSIVQHYIMNALYEDRIRDVSIDVQYKVRGILIGISYIEPEKQKSATKKSGGGSMHKRAALIGAVIWMKRKAGLRTINISIKK